HHALEHARVHAPPPVHACPLQTDTPATEIYTLSLHDALPISRSPSPPAQGPRRGTAARARGRENGKRPSPASARRSASQPAARRDRKSTRLNSSHVKNSYAVFCLKKKKAQNMSGTPASKSELA